MSLVHNPLKSGESCAVSADPTGGTAGVDMAADSFFVEAGDGVERVPAGGAYAGDPAAFCFGVAGTPGSPPRNWLSCFNTASRLMALRASMALSRATSIRIFLDAASR